MKDERKSESKPCSRTDEIARCKRCGGDGGEGTDDGEDEKSKEKHTVGTREYEVGRGCLTSTQTKREGGI